MLFGHVTFFSHIKLEVILMKFGVFEITSNDIKANCMAIDVNMAWGWWCGSQWYQHGLGVETVCAIGACVPMALAGYMLCVISGTWPYIGSCLLPRSAMATEFYEALSSTIGGSCNGSDFLHVCSLLTGHIGCLAAAHHHSPVTNGINTGLTPWLPGTQECWGDLGNQQLR